MAEIHVVCLRVRHPTGPSLSDIDSHLKCLDSKNTFVYDGFGVHS
jgi:hypothetical protein